MDFQYFSKELRGEGGTGPRGARWTVVHGPHLYPPLSTSLSELTSLAHCCVLFFLNTERGKDRLWFGLSSIDFYFVIFRPPTTPTTSTEEPATTTAEVTTAEVTTAEATTAGISTTTSSSETTTTHNGGCVNKKN